MTGRTPPAPAHRALRGRRARLERWAPIASRTASGRRTARCGRFRQGTAGGLAAWMGWLDLPDGMADRVDGVRTSWPGGLRRDGYSTRRGAGHGRLVALLRSSSATSSAMPLAVRRGARAELRILDSTHPDAVRGFREWANRRARCSVFQASPAHHRAECLPRRDGRLGASARLRGHHRSRHLAR